MAVDAGGNVYVADSANHRVQKITPRGDAFVLSHYGREVGALDGPVDLVVDANLYLYVLEAGNGRITKFSPAGEAVLAFGHPGSGPGELDHPSAILRDRHGTLYVADTGNGRIQRFDGSGRFLGGLGDRATCSIVAPRGLALDSALNLFVADDHANRLVVLSPEGGQIGTIGEPGGDPGQLSGPRGLATMGDGIVLIAEEHGCRVQGLTFAGECVCQIGGPGPSAKAQADAGSSLALKAPLGLALDPNTADVYVADSGSHRVLRLAYTPAPGD